MRLRIVSLMIAMGTSIAGVGSVVTAAAQTAGADAQLRRPLPAPLTVVRSFAPPLQSWAAGNRGVDLAAYAGEKVSAATAGVVLYAGLLAGRGVVSIRDGSLRTTYEPVDPVVHSGDSVVAGQLIGYVSAAADTCGPPEQLPPLGRAAIRPLHRSDGVATCAAGAVAADLERLGRPCS